MADLSKIRLNNIDYDIKDAVARAGMVNEETDANVLAMLDGFGLNTTTQLSSASAGVTAAGSSIVTQ